MLIITFVPNQISNMACKCFQSGFLSLIGLAFETFLIWSCWDTFEKSRGNVNAIMRERGILLQATKRWHSELVAQVGAARFLHDPKHFAMKTQS